MGTIFIGQDARYRLTTVDEQGEPANPSDVRFKVKSPNGTVATYSAPDVAEVIAGKVFEVVFDASSSGKWNIRAEALDENGNVVGVDEDTLIVVASNVLTS